MKFEIEKVKDRTFTVRIKVNGRVTFSNNGIDTKQAAYKKLSGLYKGFIKSLILRCRDVSKVKGKPMIGMWVYYTPDVTRYVCIDVKEINC